MNYFGITRALNLPTELVGLDESKWWLTHGIEDPFDDIIVVMLQKRAGFVSVAYILAAKLVHSDLPLLVFAF